MAAKTDLAIVSTVDGKVAGSEVGCVSLSRSHLSSVSVSACSVCGLAQETKVFAWGGSPCLNVSALKSKSGVMALASFETRSIYSNGFSAGFQVRDLILFMASCLDETSENCFLNRFIISS